MSIGSSYGQNLQNATNTAYSNTVQYGLNPALNGGVGQQQATDALSLAGLIPGGQQLGANGMIGGVPISELGLPGLSDTSSMFGPAASVSMFDSATNNGSSLLSSNGGQSGIWNYATAFNPNGVGAQLQQQSAQSQLQQQNAQLQQQNAQLQQELAMQQGGMNTGAAGGLQQQGVQAQPAQSQQSSMMPMIMMLIIVLVVLQQQKQQSDSTANSLSSSQLDTIMKTLGLTSTTSETDADKLTAIQGDKSKLDTLATTVGANTASSVSDEWNNITAKESTVDQVLQEFKLDPTQYNTIQDKLNALNDPNNNVKTTADGMWKQLGTDPTTFTNPFAEESGLLSQQADIQSLLIDSGVPNASSLTTIPDEYQALTSNNQSLFNLMTDVGINADSNATTQDDLTQLDNSKPQLDSLAAKLNLNPTEYHSTLDEASAIEAQKSTVNKVLQAFNLDPVQYATVPSKLNALLSNNNVKSTADSMWVELGTDPASFTNLFAEEQGLLSKDIAIKSLLTNGGDTGANSLSNIPDELTAINNTKNSLLGLLGQYQIAVGDASTLQGVITALSSAKPEAEFLLKNVGITLDPTSTNLQILQAGLANEPAINSLAQGLGLTYVVNAPIGMQYQSLLAQDALITNQLQALPNLPAGTDLSTLTISQKQALLTSLTPTP